MSKRIQIIVQKRSSLKMQIDVLTNEIKDKALDKVELRLRSVRLTQLYTNFEELHDELMIADPRDNHVTEFKNIQKQFYTLSAKIEKLVNIVPEAQAGPSRMNNNGNAAEGVVGRRRQKLPVITLPTFDGKFEKWLSFKDDFNNVIGSQNDLTEIDKFHYLKSALIGEAAKKLKIFSVNTMSYARAWEILTRAYEVKRLIAAEHFSAILNMPVVNKESTEGLLRIADDAQQHITALTSLGTGINPDFLVHILESKLPKITAGHWERSLERNEMPSPDQFYEFVYKAATWISKRERSRSSETKLTDSETPFKRRRVIPRNTALITNYNGNCVVCKSKKHPLYACDAFKSMTVPKRIEIIKNAKVCFNCMRSHRDRPCKFSNCTICNKHHNTLLHLEQPINIKNDNIISKKEQGTNTL